MLFIHFAFCSLLSVRNCFASFASVCWCTLMHSPPTFGRILFPYFVISNLFVFLDPVWLSLKFHFIHKNLDLSIQVVLSDWSAVCLFFLAGGVVCLFFGHFTPTRVFSFLSLSLLVPISFQILLAQFCIPVYFCSSSFGEHQFHHGQILLHKLAHFIL